MLENMYEGIGGKIKSFAKVVFIIEALGAIITGLILMFTDDDLALYGLITFILGPIAAWVSTWLLYAFGELVEKTADNEQNTSEILKLMKKDGQNAAKPIITTPKATFSRARPTESVHKWRCEGCGKMRTQTPCEHCGK